MTSDEPPAALAAAPTSPPTPTWATRREACAVVCHRAHLRRSILTALTVGTVLFAINQLDVVLTTGLTPVVLIKVGLTYLVPFCVANTGILIATRRTANPPGMADRR